MNYIYYYCLLYGRTYFTYIRGQLLIQRYHYTADLLYDWFGLDQTSKSVVNSTNAKQLIPNS